MRTDELGGALKSTPYARLNSDRPLEFRGLAILVYDWLTRITPPYIPFASSQEMLMVSYFQHTII